MTKTYSEQRQEAYFRAAIELYRLTVQIADENIDNPPEGEAVSQANITWAASLIESTFRKASELDDLGHSETIASTRLANRVARERAAAQARTGEARARHARVRKSLGL
jgi:hypothetical protein